jgi:raffinose/stachyose/melibiose transport system substrate-binding protein
MKMVWSMRSKRAGTARLVATVVLVSLLACSAFAQAKQAKDVKLTLMTWRQEDTAGFDFLATKMKEKYPEVTLEVEYIPGRPYYDTRRVRALSGELPDMFYLDQTTAEKLTMSDYCLSLNKLPAASKMLAGGIDTFTDFSGKLMALPNSSFYAGVIFYNKALFGKYGLKKPASWAEFIKVCDTLKKNGIAPISAGGKDGWAINWVVEALQTTEWRYMYKDKSLKDLVEMAQKGSLTYINPKLKEAITKYKQICDSGYLIDNVIGVSYDQSLQAFAKGEAGMIVGGNWIYSSVKDLNPALDVGAMAFPQTKGNNGEVIMFFASGIAINKDSKNVEYAKKFLELFVDQNIHSQYMNILKQYPTMKNVSVSWDPFAAELTGFSKGKKLFPASNWPEADASAQTRDRLAQEMILGTTSVDAFAEEMQKALLEDIQKIKLQ